jgi:hypothetical protein
LADNLRLNDYSMAVLCANICRASLCIGQAGGYVERGAAQGGSRVHPAPPVGLFLKEETDDMPTKRRPFVH